MVRIVIAFSVGIILIFRIKDRMHVVLFFKEIPMLSLINWKLLVVSNPVILPIKEDVIVRKLIALKNIVSAFMLALSVLIFVSAKIV